MEPTTLIFFFQFISIQLYFELTVKNAHQELRKQMKKKKERKQMKRALKKHSLANGWGDWTMLREENVLHAVDAMLSVTKRRHFGSSSRHFLRGPTAHSHEMVSV